VRGAPGLLALIENKLAIGDKQGKVPGTIPQVPLQKDLEAQIKKARLSGEWNTTERIRKELDLRERLEFGGQLFTASIAHPWSTLGE
jgi:hypothetical protein